MAKTYERADDEVRDFVHKVIEDYHPERGLDGIGIGILMISDGKNHALVSKGYPAAAMVKKVPPYARALSGMSVALIIDLRSWNELDEAGRVALIDHELTHIVVVKKDDGIQISFRLHDFYQGGFYEVAHRHGRDAPEVRHLAAQLVDDERGQLLLPGFELIDSTTGEVIAALMKETDDA